MTAGGLWRDYAATPRQKSLFRKRTQAELLLAMLRESRASDRAVELPEILRIGIAQHSARFNELRSRGFVIENELERTADGCVLSRYRLRFDPERDGKQL